MVLRFKEIYFDNGIKSPLLEIEDENKLPKDFIYELKLNNTYILDFEHGCLDNFETTNLISKILIKYNMEYIDKDLWRQFLNDKNKEDIDTIGKTNILGIPQSNQAYNLKVKELPKYKIDINNNLETLWESSESLKNCHKVIMYEEKINNIYDYSYTLLNFIFNCNFDLKIMICEICDKPFITFTKNQKKCHRVYKNNITCNQYYERIRKINQYDDPIKHLIKNVRDKLKGNEEELKKFNKILPTKKEQFANDKKLFIEWILDNYYFTEKGRKEVIKRLGLSNYL